METSSPQIVSSVSPAIPSTSSSSWAEGGSLHTLENQHWRLGILPDAGASVAFGQIRHDGDWHDLLRPTPETDRWSAMDCSSYLLVPWSNRVRDGVLRHEGRSYRLRRNADDGTALHGTAMEFSWDVSLAGDTELQATFDSSAVHGVNYPWRFSSRVGFRLDGPRLVVDLSVRNEDEVPVPVGFGHHPYFRRRLTGPGDDVRLEIPCREYFELVDCLPTGPAVPVEPRVDFTGLRPLGEEWVDDCLTGRDPEVPIRLSYPSGVEVTLQVDEVFSNVVLYIPTGSDVFAVEPVTNANDGFTLLEEGIPGSGILVLAPGEERGGRVTVEVTAVG